MHCSLRRQLVSSPDRAIPAQLRAPCADHGYYKSSRYFAMASQLATVSAFVEGAPPGEVGGCISQPKLQTDSFLACKCHCWYALVSEALEYTTEVTLPDIKALTIEEPSLVSQLGPAFEKYNEEQFATVKLPGSSQHVSQIWQSFRLTMLIVKSRS